MNKFLETYNLPKIENRKSEQITSNEIESVIKILAKNKSPRPDGSQVNSIKVLKKS